MGKIEKTINRILSGASDRNISFSDICVILKHLDFNLRIKGDHHIFTKTGVKEIINLQPKGSKAKPYQVRQLRNLILKYKLNEK